MFKSNTGFLQAFWIDTSQPVELEALSHAKSGTASVEVRKGQPPSGNSLELRGTQGAQF